MKAYRVSHRIARGQILEQSFAAALEHLLEDAVRRVLKRTTLAAQLLRQACPQRPRSLSTLVHLFRSGLLHLHKISPAVLKGHVVGVADRNAAPPRPHEAWPPYRDMVHAAGRAIAAINKEARRATPHSRRQRRLCRVKAEMIAALIDANVEAVDLAWQYQPKLKTYLLLVTLDHQLCVCVVFAHLPKHTREEVIRRIGRKPEERS